MNNRAVKWAGWALVGLAAVSLFAAGCSTNAREDVEESFVHLEYYQKRDMRSTVALMPQKATPRPPDSLSVPITGKERFYDREYLAAHLHNPIAYSDSVFARGERKFMRMCTPCHGTSMKGDGPVAPKFIPPPDLLAKTTRERADGYIYSYIRHGGAVMPSYGDRVTEEEAWMIITYIREMQKRNPR